MNICQCHVQQLVCFFAKNLRAGIAALGDEDSAPDATPERKILHLAAAEEEFGSLSIAEQKIAAFIARTNPFAKFIEQTAKKIKPGSPGKAKARRAEFEFRENLYDTYEIVFGVRIGATPPRTNLDDKGGPGIQFVTECLERIGLPTSDGTIVESLRAQRRKAKNEG